MRIKDTTLTEKQRAFVDEYLVDLNGSAAARRAGYAPKNAARMAVQLLENETIRSAIQAAIDARSQRTQIAADRVLTELARLAFFDIRKLYDDEGNPVPLRQLDDDTARAVVGIERVQVGNSEVGFGEVLKMRLADKRAALELLGKHLGLFSDKLRIEGDLRMTNRVIKVPLKELAEEQQQEQTQQQTQGNGSVMIPPKDDGGWKPA